MSFHSYCLFKLVELDDRIRDNTFWNEWGCHECDGLNYECPVFEPTDENTIRKYLDK